MWTCAHNVDGRDFCDACYAPALTEGQRELLRAMAAFPREVVRLRATDVGAIMKPWPWHANRVCKQLLPGLVEAGLVKVLPHRHANLIELLPEGRQIGLAVPVPRPWAVHRMHPPELRAGHEILQGHDWRRITSITRGHGGRWHAELEGAPAAELGSNSLLDVRVYE